MDYRYAGTYSDRSRIDKLNKLTNPYSFWDDVEKFTKNLTSLSATNSWKHLADIRYDELLRTNGLTKNEVDCKVVIEQSTEELILIDIEKLIKNARTEQKILDNIMDKLFKKIDELGIDLDVPTDAENAECLDEAINCYIHCGEFTLKGLIEEIKEQIISR